MTPRRREVVFAIFLTGTAPDTAAAHRRTWHYLTADREACDMSPGTCILLAASDRCRPPAPNPRRIP